MNVLGPDVPHFEFTQDGPVKRTGGGYRGLNEAEGFKFGDDVLHPVRLCFLNQRRLLQLKQSEAAPMLQCVNPDQCPWTGGRLRGDVVALPSSNR